MKSIAVIALFVAAAFSPASAEQSSPIEKIMEMISDLQSKIIAEGTDAQKVYDEQAEWCSDRSTKLGFEIKTGKANVEELSATIEEATSTIGALETKIEELSAAIQSDEADLKAATDILSKEMAKGGAAMLQMQNANNLVDALKAMV